MGLLFILIFFYIKLVVIISNRRWNINRKRKILAPVTETVSTFLRPPSSKELHNVSCLILGVKLFQMKAFCILCISSIDCFKNEVINIRYIILNNTNVLKIIIFPFSGVILHKFKTFCILVILLTKFFCVCNF